MTPEFKRFDEWFVQNHEPDAKTTNPDLYHSLRYVWRIAYEFGVQEEKAQWNAVMSMVPVKHT